MCDELAIKLSYALEKAAVYNRTENVFEFECEYLHRTTVGIDSDLFVGINAIRFPEQEPIH